MLQELQEHIEQNELIQTSDRLLVAVSGGVDSMALAELLRQLNYEFDLVHVNFQLRDEASDRDAQLVSEWSVVHGIVLHSCCVDTMTYANEKGISVQMAARDLRYDYFEQLMRDRNFSHVVTAHHANDNLETVLFNLSKGCGIRGVRGIKGRAYNRIRPLLVFSKDQLIDWAMKVGLKWREDVSNDDIKYQRNLIRKEVIPTLQQINPSLLETINHTFERLQGVERVIDDRLEVLRSKFVDQTEQGVIIKTLWINGDNDSFLLCELLRDYGVTYVQSKQIVEALGNVGALFLTNKYTLNIDRDQLVVRPIDTETANEILIDSSVGDYEFYGRVFQTSVISKSDFRLDTSSLVAQLDLACVKFPLIIRKWKLGDSFVPLGMKGRKKVSDFLVDEKIPRILKQDVHVVESDGQICWIVSQRIDDRFKVTDKTHNVLTIKML
ncbi:MAG: tRNA lysidine(34) synthetase TilS [Cyclobacteriaceae bacterium]